MNETWYDYDPAPPPRYQRIIFGVMIWVAFGCAVVGDWWKGRGR